MGDKACKKCRLIVKKSETCPICNGKAFTTNWKGYVIIFDKESDIAKKMDITTPGKYALRLGK